MSDYVRLKRIPSDVMIFFFTMICRKGMKNMKTKEAGFTLVELLSVLLNIGCSYCHSGNKSYYDAS